MLQVKNYKRQFVLFELLREKYGADKIEFGLQILHQWLAGTPGTNTIQLQQLKDLLLLSKDKAAPDLDPALAAELRKFFGLLTIDQLYNKDAL